MAEVEGSGWLQKDRQQTTISLGLEPPSRGKLPPNSRSAIVISTGTMAASTTWIHSG